MESVPKTGNRSAAVRDGPQLLKKPLQEPISEPTEPTDITNESQFDNKKTVTYHVAHKYTDMAEIAKAMHNRTEFRSTC